ncbi:MAG: hypothetical protein [Bacteriophage sp.]|nr:MAG: hypothetical protein [Bacteriophage sp.]
MTNTNIDNLFDALITMRTNNKVTIKGMVAKLTEQGFDPELWDTRSKFLFIESIDAHAKELADNCLVSELDALKVDISRVIADAGKSAFELGNLLLKAREACETQQEFLDWVDTNFGIKKAWAFKLMKVSQVFTAEPWASVATSVLYTLQAQASDEQILEARKFAEAGSLDLNTVKALLAPPVAVVKQQQASDDKVAQRAAESTQEALMSVEPLDVAPAVEPEQPKAPVLSPVVDKGHDELLMQVSQMTETIRQLTEKLAEATKPRLRSSSDMPMLRQFNSSLMHVRLGLSQQEAQSKDTILEAFRDLCKAGYGRAHEAFALLDEARHVLIHQIAEMEVAA